MLDDPRHRNVIFDHTSIGRYLDQYVGELKKAFDTVDRGSLERTYQLIEDTSRSGGRIFAIGNGGSAGIADHLSCDWLKGTRAPGNPTIDTLSLSTSASLYSAIANDFGFERVFSMQIEYLGRQGDLLIAISSSGTSANILRAVDVARSRQMATVGLSGFDGGSLRRQVDVSLHVSSANYGIVEDCHQALAHVLAQFIAVRRDLG